MLAGGALLLAAAAGVWQWAAAGPGQAPGLKVLPLTTYQGSEFYPAISRDGNQVAFVWNGAEQSNFDIYTRLIDGGAPLRLTTDTAAESFPAFSPDGRRIAFRRGPDVYVMPALGGPERKLASGKSVTPPPGFGRLSWSADGRWVAFADNDPPDGPSAIFLVAVDSGERRRISVPPPGALRRWGDNQPAYSFDGKMLAFVRGTGISAAAIYVAPLASGGVPAGEPRRVTPDGPSPNGLDWSPDSGSIIYATLDGVMRVAAHGRAGPELLLPGVRAAGFSVTPAAHRAVYHQPTIDWSVWRVRASGNTSPAPFIASTKSEFAPDYSPDGNNIVFTSNRSGRHELWVCDRDAADPVQLTAFGGPLVGLARYSPDGRQIAFVSRAGGSSSVYFVSAAGGNPVRLTDGSANDASPAWSADGRWVYFHSSRGGDYQIWRMPANGGQPARIAHSGGDVFALNVSRDRGAIYFSRRLESGIWRIPTEGGQEMRVLDQGRMHDWELSRSGIYLLRRQLNRLEFYPFGSRRPSRTIQLPAGTRLGPPESRSLAISPDEQWILYTQIDRDDADLMLIENLR
jgi:Tol biopolymer transport system component